MSRFYSLLILCALAGLSAGFVIRRAIPHGVAQNPISVPSTRQGGPVTTESTTESPSAKKFEIPHSTDTQETLIALDDAALYARLALWLSDASEADIAVFLERYSKKDSASDDITKLIFINWTRLNPRGALAAVGEDFEYEIWNAWACNSPQAAFAAALQGNEDILETVIDAIGEHHPEWLRDHFQELPANSRENAAYAMAQLEHDSDPLKTLQFLEENHQDVEPNTLKALAREDPWAAFDWAKNAGIFYRESNGTFSECMDAIVETLAAERPDDLARMAAQASSGDLKLKLEAAQFTNLLKSDPAAALAQAEATTITRTAAERYAAIGSDLVQKDPTQAYQIAAKLLEVCPDPMNFGAKVETPNDTDSVEISISGVDVFLESLMAKGPEKLLALCTAPTESGEVSATFERLAGEWAEKDLSAYAAWVNQQTLPAVREGGALLVISALRDEGHYEEALDWAMNMDNSSSDRTGSTFGYWYRADSTSAMQWLDASNLPADRKAEMKARFVND